MRALFAVGAALAGLAGACSGVPTAAPPPAPVRTSNAMAVTRDIGELHRARCGACHVRVEPGARSREVLTSALAKHRTRVHLSGAEWDALVDYLAAHPAS